jgi:hypothetical protein
VRASDPLLVLGAGRADHTGKGRTGIRSLHRQQCPNLKDRTPRPTSLQGRAQKAASQPGYRFRNLYGRLDEDFLTQCWRDSRQDAASGVDGVSAQAYEQHLDATIHDLGERLQQKRSRAKLVRRQYIPKGDGTQRARWASPP